MSKAYPYPDDEFDAAAEQDGPRGVHRAPRSTLSRMAPFVIVLLFFGGLAVGGVSWLSRGDNAGIDLPGLGEETDAAPEETTPEGTPTEETPVEETPVEETPVEETPAPVLTTPVQVLNAAGVQGLAGKAADRLTAAGFTDVTAGNARAADFSQTVVYYVGEDLRVTADFTAQTLGIAAVEPSPGEHVAASGIVVVLKSDFTG